MKVTPRIFATDNLSKDKRLCFVLMPFTTEFSEDVFSRIKDICRKGHGITALRADGLSASEVIIDSIWDHVVKARFIVADLTNKNANVFYELGLAHALGKYVILITQDPSLPFDVAGIRCLPYKWDPKGIKVFEGKLKKFVSEAVLATEDGSYYPQSDGEADAAWELQMRGLTENHRRDMDLLREKEVGHLRQIQELQSRLTRREIEFARRENTSAPRLVLDAMHRLEYSVDPEDRLSALNEMMNRGDRFPVPNVLALLEHERNPRVRMLAIQCVGSLGDSHHFTDLLALYESSADIEFSDCCVKAMFRLDAIRSISELQTEILGSERVAKILLPLMHGFDRSWASQKELLEKLLESSSTDVRWMALKVLAREIDGPWSQYPVDLGELQAVRADIPIQELVRSSIDTYKSQLRQLARHTRPR